MIPSWMLPGWLESASEWIRGQLEQRNLYLTGPIEQPQVRPWSTILRIPTTDGALFFKATAPVLGHEPALTAALTRWRPECIVKVLATDLDRGWMLMSDGGPTLRSLIRPTHDWTPWRDILPLYAELQIDMIERVPELLALGTLDRRLADLPQKVAQMVEDSDNIPVGLPDNLTAEEYQHLRRLMPHYAEQCTRLAEFGLPETLHHDDFHDGNIFMQDDRPIFSDWGESCVAFPFFTMLVGLRSIAYSLELDEKDPEIAALRDAYLEPWTRYASYDVLREAFALAIRVGMANRALTWYAVVSVLDPSIKADYIEAVPGWLQEFLHASSV